VESTSVKNVKGRIELHRIDIAKLDTKSKKYSEQIYKVMDLGKVWEKKVEDAIKAGLKPDKVSKVKAGLKSVEDALDKLLNSTIKVNEAVEKAWENQHRFEDTIKKLSEGVQAWTKWVDVVVGATVDIGIAVGKPDVIMEAVVNTFITVSNDAVQAAAG
jgi:flagellar biosynthesis chaperone FliJ